MGFVTEVKRTRIEPADVEPEDAPVPIVFDSNIAAARARFGWKDATVCTGIGLFILACIVTMTVWYVVAVSHYEDDSTA